jgi:hypothetical protein
MNIRFQKQRELSEWETENGNKSLYTSVVHLSSKPTVGVNGLVWTFIWIHFLAMLKLFQREEEGGGQEGHEDHREPSCWS